VSISSMPTFAERAGVLIALFSEGHADTWRAGVLNLPVTGVT
jgi:hypothetical protein